MTPDGGVDCELARCMGNAKADFDALSDVWTHSSTWTRKVRVYVSLVKSKLLYATSSFPLTQADERRPDGFRNCCLRAVVGRDAAVREKAHRRAAYAILCKRRFPLLGKVLRAGPGHPVRTCCFVPTALHPLNDFYVHRCRGPSKEWMKEIIPDVCQLLARWSVQASM